MKTNKVETILRMEEIIKEFSGVRVLHGVDFNILRGEVMGLMGENGAGKSTLMKILAGVHTNWEGRIVLNNHEVRFQNTKEAEESGIAIIYQELNLIPELSVAENIFLGREPCHFAGIVDYNRMNKMAEDILADLHFTSSVRIPVSELRVGHQQLVEIGKALSLNAQILIMDEPTSALSEAETKILFSVISRLKKWGVSIIYISHRMAEVFEIADRITVLRDGACAGVKNVDDVTRQKIIKMMVGQDFDHFFVKEGKPEDEIILRVKNLSRKHPDESKRHLVDNVSFDVKKGEQFGIAGLLGAGRTELLESIFGVAASDTTGTIEINNKTVILSNPEKAIQTGIAFITEDRKGNGLIMGMSIEHNMTLAALKEIVRSGFILSKVKERKLAEDNVKQLSIHVNDLNNPIESLSGGNQQKILLSKWLATEPCILLLDDPTRGIDVGAKHEIYVLLSKLAKQGMTIIMASSELQELLSICDRIMVLREGKFSEIFNRNEATQEKILDAAAPLA
jgi:ABC-type sugar transport system ATPase subunit